MAVAPIEPHALHSERLILHAEREIARGDRLQASEKAWGAVAHRVKDIAVRRGWRYETHGQIYGIVRRLAMELGEPRLEDLLRVAAGLHKNFYMDAKPVSEIERELGMVKEMLAMLSRVG